jgi:hypothetical protein
MKGSSKKHWVFAFKIYVGNMTEFNICGLYICHNFSLTKNIVYLGMCYGYMLFSICITEAIVQPFNWRGMHHNDTNI